jgi:hypothetical protein
MKLYLKKNNQTLYLNFKKENITWIVSNNTQYSYGNHILTQKYYDIWKFKINLVPKYGLSGYSTPLPINSSINYKLFTVNYSSYNSLPITKAINFNNQLGTNPFKFAFFIKHSALYFLKTYTYLLNFILYWGPSLLPSNNLFFKKKIFRINYLNFNIKSI